MPSVIVDLSHKILTNPAKVEVTPVSSTAQMISQSVYFVDKHNKKELLKDILKDATIERVLVFTRTKHGADKVVRELDIARIPARAIHGNKSQNNRQAALTGFKNKEIRVLVATDIAARGIDIDELTHVINFELPNVSESYVHRIGRTGRAGASGIAIAFCDAEEKEYLRDIEKLIAKKIPIIDNHAYPLMNHDVVKSPQPQRGGRNFQGQKTFTRPERSESSRFDQRKTGGTPTVSSAPRKHEKKDASYGEKTETKSGDRISWGKVTKRSEKSFSKNKEAGFYNKNVSEFSDTTGGEKTFIKNPEKHGERKGSGKEFPKKSWKKEENTKKSPPKNPKPFQKSLPKGAVIYKGKGDN